MQLFIIDGRTDRLQAEAVVVVYLCKGATTSEWLPSRRQLELLKSPSTAKGTEAFRRDMQSTWHNLPFLNFCPASQL